VVLVALLAGLAVPLVDLMGGDGHVGELAVLLMLGMLAAALGVFVPVALLSLAFDWGIVGVWVGLIGLIAVRLGTCAWRFSSRRWAVIGAPGTL